MPLSASAAPLIAVTDAGTLIAVSDRLLAVTTMSVVCGASMASGAGATGAVWAIAGVARAMASEAADTQQANRTYLILNSPRSA
ncbi:hypothetical protein GCM10009087_12710 [Sphingomonas oligophenolica]